MGKRIILLKRPHLNWLDITGDGDEFGPLLLDEGCDGVDSVPHDVGPLGLLSLAALSLSLSLSAQTLGLLLLGLGPVLVEKLEQVGGCKMKRIYEAPSQSNLTGKS